MSQLLISCLQEIQDQHALPGEAEDKILQDFMDGDNNLELELQGAISELKKGWQPALHSQPRWQIGSAGERHQDFRWAA